MSEVKRWWVHANNAHELKDGDVLPVGCVRVYAMTDYDILREKHDSLLAERDAAEFAAASNYEALVCAEASLAKMRKVVEAARVFVDAWERWPVKSANELEGLKAALRESEGTSPDPRP